MPITALDLFAGSGWGVACKRLGIEEMGVELMPEAIETRRINGMATVYEDVWDGLLLSAEDHEMLYGAYDVLIASPPCQTFSLAGKGAGRQALNEVLEAVQLHAYKSPAELLAFGEKHDLRTALVLSPLAYVYRDLPRYVVLEQVPTVLPVWEEYAKVMADWGYDVKTAILNAEQYGVPQTRRRAILVASLDGEAMLPVPSHSRYYSRNPKKLDPGVLPWVSMAEALGWGAKDQPCHTVTGGVHGPTDRWASGGASVRKALDAKIGGPEWVPRTDTPDTDGRTEYADRFDVAEVAAIQTYPVFRNGNQANAARRPLDAPAPTVHFGARSNKVEWMDSEAALDPAASGELVTVDQAAALQTYPVGLVGFPRLADGRDVVEIDGKAYRARDLRDAEHPAQVVTEKARSWKHFDEEGAEPITTDEAAALQTYPSAVKNMGAGMVERYGERPGREGTEPAFTIRASAGGTEPGGFRLEHEGEARKLDPEEAAALQTYPAGWGFTERPAMTVTGHGMVTRSPTGQKRALADAAEAGEFIFRPPFDQDSATKAGYVEPEGGYLAIGDMFHPDSINCTPEENAVLQTYPEPPFRFAGTKSKQFLQIGNAVPPLLAQRILEAQVMAGELI